MITKNAQQLVEDYLYKKCDPKLHAALKNLMKVVFHSMPPVSPISELEMILASVNHNASPIPDGNFALSKKQSDLPSVALASEQTQPSRAQCEEVQSCEKQIFKVPELEESEMIVELPRSSIEVARISEAGCHAVTSSFFAEPLLKSERPAVDPEQYAYRVVSSIDSNDYVLQATFMEEMGLLQEGSAQLKRSTLAHQREIMEEGSSSEPEVEFVQTDVGSQLFVSTTAKSKRPKSVQQEENAPAMKPAAPNMILTPMKQRPQSANGSESSDFIQSAGDEEMDLSTQVQRHIASVVEGLELGQRVSLQLNDRLAFPMRCEWVRRLCVNGEVPDVLRFLHSSFQIPVHYDVYGEFAGLSEFADLPSVSLLAGRYVVVEQKYNSDGVFGEVLCAYDVLEGCYVALKRQKTPDAFSQLVNEVRTLLYINSHDRPSGHAHFSLLKDFFIQHGCLFLVFEFLGENLYRLGLRYQEQRSHTFSLKQLQYITQKILRSVAFLERLGIQHFDLKPENVVLVVKKDEAKPAEHLLTTQRAALRFCQREYPGAQVKPLLGQLGALNIPPFPESDFELEDEIEVKLIDIGSHHFFDCQATPYVQSRFYRAPEVILGIPADSRAETFSWGTVLYELAVRDPLFVTNVQEKFYQQQLANFVGLLGPLPQPMILAGSNSHLYFTRQMKLFAFGDQIVQNFDTRFTAQSQEELEDILNESEEEAHFFYMEPLRMPFRRFFRNRLEQAGYFDTERTEDIAELIDFVHSCLQLDLEKRPRVRDLLEAHPYAGGVSCGSQVASAVRHAQSASQDAPEISIATPRRRQDAEEYECKANGDTGIDLDAADHPTGDHRHEEPDADFEAELEREFERQLLDEAKRQRDSRISCEETGESERDVEGMRPRLFIRVLQIGEIIRLCIGANEDTLICQLDIDYESSEEQLVQEIEQICAQHSLDVNRIGQLVDQVLDLMDLGELEEGTVLRE